MSITAALLALTLTNQNQTVSFTQVELSLLKKIESIGGSASVVEEDGHTLLSLDIENKDKILDFKSLAGLERLNAIRVLQGAIKEDSLTTLIKFKKLELLVIVSNGLTNRGLRQIGKISSLQKLDFKGAKISKMGLAELSNLKSMKRLFLYNTEIKDSDLDPLASLTSLNELCLPTTVTEEGSKNLAKRLPKTAIRRL